MLQKRATMKEIARQLNVAVSTVSRALSDHHNIGLGTKIKVRKLAEKLNFESNERAVFFKQGKTFTIGAILPELSESFFSTAMTGIEDTAARNSYMVIVGQSHNRADREKQIVKTMKDHRVDGLVISLAKDTSSYEHFDMLKRMNIPVVFFDRIPQLADVHYITCDMESGTIQAIDFLVKKNHSVIGMINGPENNATCRERGAGYRKAMTKNKLGFDPGLIISTDLTTEGTEEAMGRLLSLTPRPTAIIVFNDSVAVDAMKYARSNKLRINKDICFVSYASLPVSSYLANPPLASVDQYPYLQGQKATEVLLELLSGEDRGAAANYRIIVSSKLIVHKE